MHPRVKSHIRIRPFFVCCALILLLGASFVNVSLANEKRTKLCADKECKVDLFPSHFIRDWESSDPNFLKFKKDAAVKVVAFRFSNRPDLMEALSDDGRRGYIFTGHIDLTPFLFFLESALKTNQSLYVVEQTGEWPKLINQISAIPDLWREYVAYAGKVEDYQLDKQLVSMMMNYDDKQKKRQQEAHHHHHSHKTHGIGHGNGDAKKNVVKEEQNEQEQAKNPKQTPESVTSKEEIRVEEAQIQKELPDVPKEVTDKQIPQASTDPVKPLEEAKKSLPNTADNEKKEAIDQQMEKKESDPLKVENAEVQKSTEPIRTTTAVDVDQSVEGVQPKAEENIVVQHPPSEKVKILDEPLKNEQHGHGREGFDNTEKPQQQQPSSSKDDENSVMNDNKINPEQQPIKNEQQTPPSQQENSQQVPPVSLSQQENSQQVPPVSHTNNPNPTLKSANPPQPSSFSHDQQQTTQAPSTGQNSIKVENLEQLPPSQDPILKKLHSASTTPPQSAPSVTLQSLNKAQEESKPPPEAIIEQERPTEEQEMLGNSLHFTTPAPPMDVNLGQQQEQQQPLLHNNPELQLPTEPPLPPPIDPTPQNVIDINDLSHEKLADGVKIAEKREQVQQQNLGEFTRDYGEHHGEEAGVGLKNVNDDAGARGENSEQPPQKYCFKDDCQELDSLPHDSSQQLPSADSGPRRMFREWMHSVRLLLPAPLCHFEDTGLIVLAFVLISLFLHIINRLLSTSTGPEPFDHRLLHDCITRLKEQELIIEKAKNNATINQQLLEEAKGLEQLQKQNQTLDIRLKSSEKKANDLESENGKLKQSLRNTQHELEKGQTLNGELKASVEAKDTELKEFVNVNKRIESELNEAMSKLVQSQNKERYLEQDLKEASSNLDRIKLELNDAQREMEKWRNECGEKKAEIDELLGIVAELNSDNARSGKGDGKAKSAGRGEGKQKKDGEEKTSSTTSSPGRQASILDAVELDPDNGGASGGSAGWSDLGDGMEIAGAVLEESSEKTMRRTSSPIPEDDDNKPKTNRRSTDEAAGGKLLDILEMAKLKSRLRSLETERDQIKLSLKVEREEKEHMVKEVERLRQELVVKERDSEQRELNRHGLTQQCTKLLQMIEEKERKVEHSDQERERLRAQLSEVELQLRKVDDERREIQRRLKELEKSLKESKEINGRLENKLYHEERRLNAKIRYLEEQLTIAKTSLSPLNMSAGGVSSDLNLSGNSSDRDFAPLNTSGGAGGERIGSVVPSLWSEIDASEPVEELISVERKGASMRRRSMRSSARDGLSRADDSRESPFLNDLVHVNKSGREEYHHAMNSSKLSGLGAASVHSAVVPRQRMRSRSAGRQSVARLTGIGGGTTNLYGTIGTAGSYHRASVVPYQNASGKNSPFRQPPERPLSAARLRNALGTVTTATANTSANYYSSDSASSPPPEMPLLSGVPPPGLNKRPAVVVRAQKPNIQLHKPMAAPK